MTSTAAYIIKCDECKVTIGETDSMRESAAGGRCIDCVGKALKALRVANTKALRSIRDRQARDA